MFVNSVSGEQLGLVKDHKHLTLQEALDRIEKPRLNDFSFSVHAFRGVMQPEKMPTLQEITTPLEKFAYVQTMASVSEHNIYEKIMTNADLKATGNQVIVTPEFHCGNDANLENPRAVASYVDSYFLRMTSQEKTALYFYNCDCTPPGFRSCLDGIRSNLHASRNPGIAVMPGINEPMFYAGGPDSITEMHVEDGIADSINIIHAGQEKLWFVVEKLEYVRLNKLVAEELKKKKFPNKCDFPLHHKNLVLTPRFLDSHGIRYEFVLQRAGDLLYVRYGVPHQVINVGPNIAEAVNFGSAEWNLGNPLHTFCQCSRASITPLPENVLVNHSVKTGRLRSTHACEINECQKVFATKALLQNHQQQTHSSRHKCSLCDKSYAQDKGLARHVAQVHRETRNCNYCGKSFVNIRRHERDVHEKQVNCPTCKVTFTMEEMKQHARVCSIKFCCTSCTRDFPSKRSLGIHRSRCKARE